MTPLPDKVSLVEHQHEPKVSQDLSTVNGNSDKGPWVLRKEVGKPKMHASYEGVDERIQAFRATIESYNAEAGSHNSVQLDTQALHTWEDVLKMQRLIIEDHEAETSKGLKGFWHKSIRRIGKNSECFQAWLKLLPTASPYVSVPCGGFILLLEAANRSFEIAEEIRSVLDDISSTLSTAEQYLTTFEESAALHKCSAALYVAILDSLEAIIREYHKHIARRISSRIFKQSLSGQHISEKVEQIHSQANRLAALANIESLQRQKIMLERGEDVGNLVVSLARTQADGFNRSRISQQQTSNNLQSLETRLTVMADSLIQAVISEQRAEKHEKTFPGNNYSFPKTSVELEECEDTRRKLTAIVVMLSIDQDSDAATRDTATNLNLIHTLSIESQDRAVALIASPRILIWLTDTCSSALLINGQMFSSEHEIMQSPLSFFCAKTVDSILVSRLAPKSIANNPLLVVRWFCGQHTDVRTDYDAHPPGMLNNMLSQLVCQLLQPGILEMLEDLSCPLESEPGLSELCSLFVQLFKALPTGTISFCVIDGLSYYEDADRRDECMEVLSMLTDLTSQSRDIADGPLIKLLVTAPLRAQFVQRLLETKEIMNMDEIYAPNGGFSALQWDTLVGSVLGE